MLQKTKGKTSNNFYLFCILLYNDIGILLTYNYWIFDLSYFFLLKNTYNIFVTIIIFTFHVHYKI